MVQKEGGLAQKEGENRWKNQHNHEHIHKWCAEDTKEGRDYYWDSYKQYLLKKDKLPADVIERIDERSDKVMNYLFDPTNPDIKDATRRGMVIGSVQSGKTANYSALVAKAADAG